ncbi:hypothetical protein JZU54_08600 [bacterium]|nr:hypothetical protein [bacterium]
MSPPTATPRTDAALYPMNGVEIVWPYFARQLETELAASKAECERLKNQRDNLLKPLRARAEDRADAAEEKVDQLTSENEKLTIERDALANGSAIELARLRAELAVAENWVSYHSKHADDLIAENVKLRAEVERWQAEAEEMSAQRSHNANQAGRLRAEVEALKQSIESGQRVLREDAERNAARAERAEAMLAEWSVLNLWGGTPEIIHEFIKGQQNRIHHCQDLETELAHLRAAIDAAMKS